MKIPKKMAIIAKPTVLYWSTKNQKAKKKTFSTNFVLGSNSRGTTLYIIPSSKSKKAPTSRMNNYISLLDMWVGEQLPAECAKITIPNANLKKIGYVTQIDYFADCWPGYAEDWYHPFEDGFPTLYANRVSNPTIMAIRKTTQNKQIVTWEGII